MFLRSIPLQPMDSTTSERQSLPVSEQDAVFKEDHHSISADVEFEANCWGCGLRVIVFPYASVFRCGWCGAITKENAVKSDDKYYRWRLVRDRCFVCCVLVYMLFFICGGIWAVYPVVFSISYFCGVFNLTVTSVLAICTLSTFSLAAFRPAGSQPMILWGSYPTVGKGGLQNFTFCHYCSKPKSPRTHHCRSCGTCVLDMDHHCPFIGNCVGAGNHRSFIIFLISAVISTCYTAIMASYATLHVWRPHDRKVFSMKSGVSNHTLIFKVSKEIVFSLFGALVFQQARVLVLFYLFIASFSAGIGLGVLLCQQLGYIYAGKTYLSQLSNTGTDEKAERDCRNIFRFFGFPYNAATYLPNYWKSRKSHEK